ncbi:molecular chaperone [Sphingopyxis sp.]|uniref:fimbrial biogenesis chaperone n=1 Tax=Sphingopyxis sp. TaxID=1908224 RepID=UPI003BAB06A6
MRSIWLSLALLAAAIGLLVTVPHPADAREAPSSVLIWPVGPVIEADRQAAALWLENPGITPVMLQVRIYTWDQQDGRNVYADQGDVIGTPPIVSIAPGTRQLVRLTRTGAAPEAIETPYRVIIDEIPAADAETMAPSAAVSFRMRYSLPLFVEGRGAGAKDKNKLAPAPILVWRIAREGEGSFVELRNTGPVHARLTEAALGGTPLASGLLGYVLAGRTMRWPLPEGTRTDAALIASINGAPAAPIAPQPD